MYYVDFCNIFRHLTAILNFLNISKCSMMPRWHHSDSPSERYQELKSIKTFYAAHISRSQAKSMFGNWTMSLQCDNLSGELQDQWSSSFTFTKEPPHRKTNNLCMRKQRRRSAKLISAFVFATRIVQSLYFLNTKFHASSCLLLLCSPVCVGPVQKPH